MGKDEGDGDVFITEVGVAIPAVVAAEVEVVTARAEGLAILLGVRDRRGRESEQKRSRKEYEEAEFVHRQFSWTDVRVNDAFSCRDKRCIRSKQKLDGKLMFS